MQVDAEVGAGAAGDVLVVELEPRRERVRELVADHSPVPAGAQALQDAQIQMLADQVRPESRHRLEAGWRPGEGAGGIHVSVAGGGGSPGENGPIPGETRPP